MARLTALCPEPENYSRAGLDAAAELLDLDTRTLDATELLAEIENYDVLLIRLKTFVGSGLLERASRLKAIITPTTGLNHIDLETAGAKGVAVFHLRGEVDFLRTVASTAEHTWALLLALMRNLPAAHGDVLAGRWRQDPHRGRELADKRLGIVGLGRLGEIVARYGSAFGMDVAAFDTGRVHPAPDVRLVSSLAELAGLADVLTVHVPLNDETRGMIDASILDRLPESAVLVNTSRGEIVDENALIDSLRTGRLSGAAVDVLSDEEAFAENALVAYAREHPNVIVTPHIGGATFEAVEKTDLFVLGRFRAWLEAHDG